VGSLLDWQFAKIATRGFFRPGGPMELPFLN
jgi:hypothetical protein